MIDRNNIDQALAVIAPAPERTAEAPILISTELPHFKANYVSNRAGASQYTNLSELGFLNSAKRKFGTDITEPAVNGVNEAIFGGSKTHSKCSECHIWLCVEGPCWQQYHNSIGVKC